VLYALSIYYSKIGIVLKINPFGKLLNTLPLSRFMPRQNEFTPISRLYPRAFIYMFIHTKLYNRIIYLVWPYIKLKFIN
jgi:hypothetical protein